MTRHKMLLEQSRLLQIGEAYILNKVVGILLILLMAGSLLLVFTYKY
jgi:hypothetical protein